MLALVQGAGLICKGRKAMALGSREGWKEVLRAGHGEVGAPVQGAEVRCIPRVPDQSRGWASGDTSLPARVSPKEPLTAGPGGTRQPWHRCGGLRGGHADATLGPGSRERNAMGTGAEPGPSARASLSPVGHLPCRGNPQTTAVIGAQAGPPRAPPRSPAHMM